MLAAKMQLCSRWRAICHMLQMGTATDKICDKLFQILIAATAQLTSAHLLRSSRVLSSATLVLAAKKNVSLGNG